MGKPVCEDRCLNNAAWICTREAGHIGRHMSDDGGDWHDDGQPASYSAWCAVLGAAAGRANARIVFGPETYDAWRQGSTPDAYARKVAANQGRGR